jgi:hypothetical protein
MAAYRRGKKIQPAELTMSFSLPAGTNNSTIDLSQCASLVNRRFYRQGINWVVESFKVLTSSGITGGVTVNRIPTTWVAYQAWKKAFVAWNEQQKSALEESGAEDARARFSDFKIHADVTHVTAGFAGNLLPIDANAVTYAAGEWEASQIVVPNALPDGTGSTVDSAEYTLHMVGVNNNAGQSRGVIEGYADSRAYPQSPDPVSPDLDSSQNWMARMQNVGKEQPDVLDNATDRNDNLPYPQVNYPGGETQAANLTYHDTSFITATTVGGTSRMKGGVFPAGLIRILSTLTIPQNEAAILQINLVPGEHRGYLCEAMGDA